MANIIKYNERPLFEGLSRLENIFSSDWAALDVQENGDSIDIIVDLPGVKKEDVKINCENNLLDISAFREKESSNGDRSERSWGEIKRTVSLPGRIQAESADAHLENGVLRISMPKSEKPLGQQIKIQ